MAGIRKECYTSGGNQMKRLGKYRILLLVVAALLVLSLILGPLFGKDSVRECMVRYLFDHNEYSSTGNLNAYYIQIEGPKGERRDPSNYLIWRFRNHIPLVKKVSEYPVTASQVSRNPSRDGIDLRIRIKHMKWTTPWSVVVDVDCDGGMFLSGGSFLLARRLGGWTVVKKRTMWME